MTQVLFIALQAYQESHRFEREFVTTATFMMDIFLVSKTNLRSSQVQYSVVIYFNLLVEVSGCFALQKLLNCLLLLHLQVKITFSFYGMFSFHQIWNIFVNASGNCRVKDFIREIQLKMSLFCCRIAYLNHLSMHRGI